MPEEANSSESFLQTDFQTMSGKKRQSLIFRTILSDRKVGTPSSVKAHFQTEVYKDASESQRRSTLAAARSAGQQSGFPENVENSGFCGTQTAGDTLQELCRS
jgi:hypothetical protein